MRLPNLPRGTFVPVLRRVIVTAMSAASAITARAAIRRSAVLFRARLTDLHAPPAYFLAVERSNWLFSHHHR
jgi:hypothetical protein